MYLIARILNGVHDFGEPAYLQTSRIGIDPPPPSFTLKTTLSDANNKALASQANDFSFPSAILPVSVLDKTVVGDGFLVSGFNQVVATQIYDTLANFKLNYRVVSYKSQQGAMVVDHWVHYDEFMVVEMGEVKIRR